MSNALQLQLSRNLMRYGILLFLLGLITGFVIPAMQNPRMGLSSHLEGTMNGMFLVLAGLVWTKLRLSDSVLIWGYRLALFGTFINWGATFLAGIWGAGGEMMPIAASGLQGAAWQEIFIKISLISLSFAMLIVCGLLFWGLRGRAEQS